MDSPPVLFLPIINWEFRNQRPQQLARCFARAGNRVFYPHLHLCPAPPPPQPLEGGIWQVALRGDDALDPYRDRLCAAAVEAALDSLRELSAEHPLDGCWIVAQLPFWRPLAEAARSAFGGALLFDCMDDFSAFGDHGDLQEEERALAAAADLVVVTAQRLYDRLAPFNPRTRIVRNGCDPAHFGPVVARATPREPVVVGFFGGIHDWFDGDLVAALARLRPGWEFRLIGDTYRGDIAALRTLPNVFFLGEAPYAELPRLISAFHAGIIPFKTTPLTEATDPIKVYEMLAAGLPVVAVDLPELRRLEPLVAIAHDASEFAARIEESLGEPLEARVRRLEFARRQSWIDRFLELRQAMDQVPCNGRRPPRRAASPAAPERYLSFADLKRVNAELLQRLGAVEAKLRDTEAVPRDTAAERLSLIEQRDRVQAEAERLQREVTRIEAERLALETAARRYAATLSRRLATRGRSLLARFGL
jgi:glycosyltransferase involved in cell wall biosynthesis